jgi:N-methylhydantoinase A
MKQIYIPRYASVFCALGIMVADYKHILTRFLGRREDEITLSQMKSLYDSMEEEGLGILRREKISENTIKFIRGAEMHYYGQLHDIEILLPDTKAGADFTETDRKTLITGFHERHKAVYGWANDAYPVAFSTLKMQAIGVRRPFKPIKQTYSSQDASGAQKRKRLAYFRERGGLVETTCYDGRRLGYGNLITGPAIIEEVNTTIVLPPEAELTVDVYGNYSVKR